MSNSSTSSVSGVQRIELTDDDLLEIVKNSVKNIDGVISIYETFRTNHLKRIVLYSEIDSMIAGNPPYRREDLKSAGINAANFNTLEPRSLYEKACQVYWNLLFTSESVININFRYPEEPDAKSMANKVSKHWNDVVRDMWQSFDVNTSMMAAQLVKFGVSPVIWPDERDPRWRVAELSKFFIPDQTSSDIDLMSMIFIETEVPLIFLLQAYQAFKDKPETSPWDLVNLKSFLVYMANAALKETVNPNDALEMSRKIMAGDISYDKLYNESVRMVSYFIKENDGKVSHYMFNREFSFQGGDTAGKHKGFLYSQENQYNCFQECFLIFTQSPGEARVHANRGLGHKLFSLSQAKMMLDNSLVDMGRWASTPIIKSSAIGTKDFQQVRVVHGQPTNLGTSELVQNGLGANLEAIISVSNHIGGMLQRNIAHSGDDASMPDASNGSQTPLEIKYKALREFGILKNQVNHFYKTYDVLLKQMVIKMLKSKRGYPGYDIAEEWKRRCIADGVPEMVFAIGDDDKILPSTWDVKATRSAGAGSQVAVLLGLQEMLSISGSFGTREAAAFKREWIKATMGVEYVEEFTQDRDETDENGNGTSVAHLENIAMKAGQPAKFTPSNDHRAHFSEHMKLASDMIGALNEQQFDIVEADSILTQLLPHMRQHWEVLKASPFNANFVAQFETNFAQLEKQATLIRANAIKQLQAKAKEQEQAQQAQEQVMTDAERKDYQATRDEARKDFKVQSQAERAEEASTVRARATDIKTESDIANKRRKTDAEIEAIRASKAKEALGRGAGEEAINNPKAALKQINSGNTLSPYDIE